MNTGISRLVILGSTLTSLSLVRHCRALGLQCVVIDTIDGPASYSRLPLRKWIGVRSDADILSLVLKEAGGAKCALIADSDVWLQWLIIHRLALDSAFATVMHPRSEVLKICLDKSRFLSWCDKRNLPAPKLVDVSDCENSEILYPVLVRPRVTRHRADNDLPKAVEAASDTVLDEVLERFRARAALATVCESLLRPNVIQYSVGVARNSNGETLALVAKKDRPSADWCAGGTYVVIQPDDVARRLAIAAVSALDLYGIAEVEIIQDVDADRMYLIEINPRPWVQYALSWKSGFDFLTFLLDPNAYDSNKERLEGRRWLNLKDDLYVACSRSEGMIARGKLGFWRYFCSVLRANVFPFWSWRDPKPWYLAVMGAFSRNGNKT